MKEDTLEININSENPEVAKCISDILKENNQFLIEGVIYGTLSNTEFKGEEVDIYCNIIKGLPSIKVHTSNIQGNHFWVMNPITGECTLEK